jgi:hypothetical protein
MCLLEGISMAFNEISFPVLVKYRALPNITRQYSTNIIWLLLCCVHAVALVESTFINIPREASVCQELRKQRSEAELLQRYIITHSLIISYARSRDSVIGILTGYGLDDRGFGVLLPVGSSIFFSPRRPDRLWVPPILPSNEYRGLFLRG